MNIVDLYKKNGITIKNYMADSESIEYKAAHFNVNNYNIVYRVGKITATKIGQFVTFWKRPKIGLPIIPFDFSDDIDFLIVNVSDGTNCGQFIFNKEVLVEQKIMSKNNKGGKLAFRLYPAWVKPTSKMAIKTQQWQLQHFLLIGKNGKLDKNQLNNFFII